MVKKRDLSIDIFKAFLVIGMILCHSMQFFSKEDFLTQILITFFNFITFPGFVFAFGYTSYLAYFSSEVEIAKKKMLKNAVKILIAFYISGISYRVFVDGKPLNAITVLPIISLFDIPGWSEFLISFSLFMFVGVIFYNPLQKIVKNEKMLFIISSIFLLMTFIPYEKVNISQIGLLIGTTKFPTFPIAQYMPFYLAGMYFAKKSLRLNRNILIISFAFTISTVLYIVITGNLPGRFPPTLFWIIAPSFVIYIYYLFSKFIEEKCNKLKFIILIGENTLFYLLMSNIMIFTLAGKMMIPLLNNVETLLLLTILILMSTYIIEIIRK